MCYGLLDLHFCSWTLLSWWQVLNLLLWSWIQSNIRWKSLIFLFKIVLWATWSAYMLVSISIKMGRNKYKLELDIFELWPSKTNCQSFTGNEGLLFHETPPRDESLNVVSLYPWLEWDLTNPCCHTQTTSCYNCWHIHITNQ